MQTLNTTTLDIHDFMERVGHDKTLVEELVEMFFEELPTLLSEVGAAIQANEAEATRKAAHTLKGASANVSAYQASHLAKGIEDAGRDNNLVRAKSLYNELIHELAHLKQKAPDLLAML